jgi:hypothetical protein
MMISMMITFLPDWLILFNRLTRGYRKGNQSSCRLPVYHPIFKVKLKAPLDRRSIRFMRMMRITSSKEKSWGVWVSPALHLLAERIDLRRTMS